MRAKLKLAVIIAGALCMGSVVCKAEDKSTTTYEFADRIAFRTNLVNWLVTVPNFSVDYDVVHTAYKKQSLGLSVGVNWRSSQKIVRPDLGGVADPTIDIYQTFPDGSWDKLNPYYLIDVKPDIRVDYRFYWRKRPIQDWEKEWLANSKGLKLKARIHTLKASEKLIDRMSYIAYYFGPYASYSNFALKMGQTGYKGNMLGAGVTGGIAIPLYGYHPDGFNPDDKRRAALDLDLGASLGWNCAIGYDEFVNNTANHTYATTAEGKTRFIPYPLPGLRAALVYRFVSISEQITDYDRDQLELDQITYMMMNEKNSIDVYNGSVRELKHEIDRKNAEVTKWKKTEEIRPDYDSAYIIDYYKPIVEKYNIPSHIGKATPDTVAYSKKYKDYYAMSLKKRADALMDVRMDSLSEIADDYIVKKVRPAVGTVPGFTDEEIDQIFVNSYNFVAGELTGVNANAVGNDVKPISRIVLIRRIYEDLNTAIEGHNTEYNVHSTYSYQPDYTDRNMSIVKAGQRRNVDVTYTDSVPQVKFGVNDRIELVNYYKQMAALAKKAKTQPTTTK